MDMETIKVDSFELKDIGLELKRLQGEFVSTVNEMNKLINEIDSLRLWDGIDQDTYLERKDERYVPTLEKIEQELDDYGDYLIKAGEAYSSVENFLYEKEVDV